MAVDHITLHDITTLVPHPRNPNDGDVGAVATMIARDGWHGSILAQAPAGRRKQPRIIVGHTRWRALHMLQRDGIVADLDGTGERHWTYGELAERVALPPIGFVPVELRSMSDVQATRKMIADNRSSRLSHTDEFVLAELLQVLAREDGLLGTGYDGDDLDRLLQDLDQHDFPEVEVEADVAFGGRWLACPACGHRWQHSSTHD